LDCRVFVGIMKDFYYKSPLEQRIEHVKFL
jgi:hypothetical protein